MTIYVITINELNDFEPFHHTPMAFMSHDKAKARLRRLHEEAVQDNKDLGNDWVEDEEFTDKSECFSMYPEYEWGTSHYDVAIHEVKVED